MKKYLTTTELAERWSCSRGWLANLRCAGDGPDYAVLGSRRVLYPVDVVERYEAAHLKLVNA